MTCDTRDSGAPARGGRVRRWRLRVALAAFGLMLMAPAVAAAADMDDGALRGSLWSGFNTNSYSRWDGVYFGGQFGVSSGSADFSKGVSSLTGYIMRDSVLADAVSNMTTMGGGSTNRTTYGGFIGYNFYNVESLVLGVEANYIRLNMDSAASDQLTRIIANDSGAPSGHHYFYTTTVSASGSVHITDFATMRARAGWQTGQFLPYAFVGAAVGRASYARSATVSYTTEDKPDAATPAITPDPPPNFGPVTRSESQSNVIAYGFAAGLGVDVSLLPNVFLRAEWEYVQFVPIHDIKVSINSGRVGIGVKF